MGSYACYFQLDYMKVENMQKKNMKMDVTDRQDSVRDENVSFVDGYLLYMMAHASDAASSAFHAQLASQSVTVPTWRILACLYPDLGLNVGDLARRSLLKQPTLTRQLDRLCADGLTRRVHENRDRRGVLVSLTSKGLAKAEPLIAMARENEARVLSAYTPDQVQTFKSMLDDLTTRMRS